MICKRCGSECPNRPEKYCFHCLVATDIEKAIGKPLTEAGIREVVDSVNLILGLPYITKENIVLFNGIKTDNRLENLCLLPNGTHGKIIPQREFIKRLQAQIKRLETQVTSLKVQPTLWDKQGVV